MSRKFILRKKFVTFDEKCGIHSDETTKLHTRQRYIATSDRFFFALHFTSHRVLIDNLTSCCLVSCWTSFDDDNRLSLTIKVLWAELFSAIVARSLSVDGFASSSLHSSFTPASKKFKSQTTRLIENCAFVCQKKPRKRKKNELKNLWMKFQLEQQHRRYFFFRVEEEKIIFFWRSHQSGSFLNEWVWAGGRTRMFFRFRCWVRGVARK